MISSSIYLYCKNLHTAKAICLHKDCRQRFICSEQECIDQHKHQDFTLSLIYITDLGEKLQKVSSLIDNFKSLESEVMESLDKCRRVCCPYMPAFGLNQYASEYATMTKEMLTQNMSVDQKLETFKKEYEKLIYDIKSKISGFQKPYMEKQRNSSTQEDGLTSSSGLDKSKPKVKKDKKRKDGVSPVLDQKIPIERTLELSPPLYQIDKISKLFTEKKYILDLWKVLQRQIDINKSTVKLMFRASASQYSAVRFRKTCKTRPNALVIIKAAKSGSERVTGRETNVERIFGGFLEHGWNDGHQKSGLSFVFDQSKVYYKQYENDASSYMKPKENGMHFGPILGRHDIVIPDECHKLAGRVYPRGSFNLPVSEDPPKDSCMFWSSFRVVDYEVFEVDKLVLINKPAQF